MANYVNPLPMDKGGSSLQEFPAPTIAKEQFIADNAVASSVISLHPDTSSLEVAALGGQGAVIRWVPTTETAAAAGSKASVVASGLGANFDHYIPAGVVRRFAVPRETQGNSGPAQIGSMFGLYQRVARINAGTTASSVLVVEF